MGRINFPWAGALQPASEAGSFGKADSSLDRKSTIRSQQNKNKSRIKTVNVFYPFLVVNILHIKAYVSPSLHLSTQDFPRVFQASSLISLWENWKGMVSSRGWTRSVHLPWLGGSQIWPKPLTYLRADMPFLVGKKICTYQLTCLTKIVGIWGEYISQCTWSSHTHLLAEACLTKKHTSVHLY